MSSITIGIWISNIGLFLMVLSCLIIAFKGFYRSDPLAFLSWYMILSVIINVPAFIMAKYVQNNLPLLHLFTMMELVTISLFYGRLMKLTKNKLFLGCFISVSIAVVLNSIFFQGIFSLNSFGKTLSQIFLLGCAVMFLFNMEVFKQTFDYQVSRSLSLINAAFLIYFAGSLFIFMSSSLLFAHEKVLNRLWTVNVFLSLFFQIIIFYSLWKMPSQRTKSIQ
jgi:hypothetical protein